MAGSQDTPGMTISGVAEKSLTLPTRFLEGIMPHLQGIASHSDLGDDCSYCRLIAALLIIFHPYNTNLYHQCNPSVNHYYGQSNSWRTGAAAGDTTTFHNGSTPGTARLAAMKFFSAGLVMR